MKKDRLIVLSSLLLSSGLAIAEADSSLAPPPFPIPAGKAIFVDFISARYSIVFDVKEKKTKVRSEIVFQNEADGFPVFDLLYEPSRVVLDGHESTQVLTVTPKIQSSDRTTSVRVIQTAVVPGRHTLLVEHQYGGKESFDPFYEKGAVRTVFAMYDFSDRGLLERYLPANMEHDQFEAVFDVIIRNGKGKYSLFTNGVVQETAPYAWTVSYPSYFNSSSFYFHIGPKGRYKELQFEHRSIDGHVIPVRIYMVKGNDVKLKEYQEELERLLSKFETWFGPFPHPQILVQAAAIGFNGMEYAGAATCGLSALRHELAHSYFGRGVQSANGNSGWIDEALASLVGGPGGDGLPNTPAKMGNAGPYYRANNSMGYDRGQALVRAATSNNPIPFLASFSDKRKMTPITSQIFQKDLEEFYGRSFDGLFRLHVFGDAGPRPQSLIAGNAKTPGIHIDLAGRKDLY